MFDLFLALLDDQYLCCIFKKSPNLQYVVFFVYGCKKTVGKLAQKNV
jgi:hypothetical protein